MHIPYSIHEGNLEVDAWLQLAFELLEAMKHDGVLLANDHAEAKNIKLVKRFPYRLKGAILATLALL
jgi:hypothetical protein